MCFRFGGLIGFAVGPGFGIKKDGLDTYRSWGGFSYRHCGRHCPCSVQKVIETTISTNHWQLVSSFLYITSFSCSKSLLHSTCSCQKYTLNLDLEILKISWKINYPLLYKIYISNLRFIYYIIECNIFFLSTSNAIHYNIIMDTHYHWRIFFYIMNSRRIVSIFSCTQQVYVFVKIATRATG